MGLSWINPLYLAGTLLLALPILIHLVQRHRVNGIKFPSLMFLERIPLREKRRLEIRNWLLLLLRCLLLLLIVLAFARPFLVGETGPVALDPERTDSVVVIDRSYSMRVADHWQQAQQMALDLVDRKQAQDRIAVVVFDENATVVSDLSSNAQNLRTVIRRQAPGMRTTRLRLGLEQAARLLDASNASSRRVLLVSDFQASALRPGETPKINRDIELKMLPVDVASVTNTTISSLTIGPPSRNTVDEYSLKVEVTNHAADWLDQQLRLTVNGRQLATRDLRLAPGSMLSETFDNLGSGGDVVRGVVSLNDDGLSIDNNAFFVYSSKQQLPVLIVESAQPRPNQSLYLENALRLSRNPVFSIKRLRWQDLNPEDLANWAVIIVNDASIPGGRLGSALRDFVAAGGGLLVATGENFRGNWPAGDDGFLPGTPLHRVDSRPGEARDISEIIGDHPLTNDPSVPKGIDLSSARIFSYRNFKTSASDQVLARYSDGAPALLQTTQAQGRALVLTSTLDTHWNDLALQPAFLPFLHQALRYLADFESYPRRTEIGSVIDVMRYARAFAGGDAIVAAADDAAVIVETPSTGEIRLSRQSPLLAVTEPGFYQVHRATPAGAEVVLAVNIDPVEANLEILDPGRFVEEIRASAAPAQQAGLLTRRQVAEYEQYQQLWHAFLSVVLILMLVEAFSANWIVQNWSTNKRTGA